MHPILFRIPFPQSWHLPLIGQMASLPIYSYGVMLGLSLVVGWYLTLGLAERDGLPPDEMANCYVVTAIVAFVVARLLYIVTNPDEFKTIADWFAIRRGGLVAYGGFLGGFLGSWGYLRLRRLPLLPWADVVVPSLGTGLFLTRIGCYLYGCDFGKPLSDNAPSLLKRLGTFPHWSSSTIDGGNGSPAWFQHVEHHLITADAPASLPVHPTQIYESLVGLGLFGLVMFQRRHQRFRGQVFFLFTFAYGALRYGLEMLRDDAERGEFGPLLPQHVLIPGGLLLLAIAYSVGIARAIPNKPLRTVTQALALLPAVALFFWMRPQSFADEELVKLSTSQWVALLTGAAAAFAYGVFWDSARAHPERAMALSLEAYDERRGIAPAVDPDEEAVPVRTARKRRKKRAVVASDAAADADVAEGEGAAAAEHEKPGDEGVGDEKLEPV